jgi:Domain of unknown function (DUF222)/HNH endonuclease
MFVGMESIEVSSYSTDQLEQQLVALEESHSQIVARQSVILQELDRRGVAQGDGCRHLSEWVASRLDLSPEHATTLVRTSHRLQAFPEIAKRLDCAEVTFDRATELARWAEVAPGVDVIAEHWRFDITGLRRQAAHHRRVTRKDEQQTAREEHLVLQPDLGRSSWRLWGELSGPAGAVVEQALQQRADQLPEPPPGAPCSRSHRMALALTSLCRDPTVNSAGDTPLQLATVFVTATEAASTNGETGATLAAGPRVGPQTLEAILCAGKVEVIAVTAEGTPIGVGPATSALPPRLRRFVLSRDGGCTADGCTSRYRLQVHHRTPRSQGGNHHPENLTTQCWYHHQVVIHCYGYHIDPTSPPGRLRYLPPSRDPP